MVNCKMCGVETGNPNHPWCINCFPKRNQGHSQNLSARRPNLSEAREMRIVAQTAFKGVIALATEDKKPRTKEDILRDTFYFARGLWMGDIPKVEPKGELEINTQGATEK